MVGQRVDSSVYWSGPPPKSTPPQLGEMVALIFNYRPSIVLFTANQMEIFDKLAKGSATAAQIASQCGSIPHSTELLLNACVAIGLLEKEGDRYRNSSVAEKFLLETSPACLKHQVLLQQKNFVSYGKLYEAMFQPRPVAPPTFRDDPVESYTIATLAFEEAALVLGEYLPTYIDLTGRRKLLTIGGPMPGTLTIKVVERTPGLRARILFDDESGVRATKRLVEKYALGDRISCEYGDLLRESFGNDNDAVMLVVLQQRAPDDNRVLIKKSYDSLVPGGLIYIAGYYITNPDKASPVRSALWSLNMLTRVSAGEAYSTAEIIGWLTEAGFVNAEVKDQPEPLVFRGIIARKP